MRRLTVILSLVVALVCAAYFATAASAVPPERAHLTITGSDVVSDLCPFDITLDFVAEIDRTRFFDQEGNRTRSELQQVEQDTFSANGKTLVSEPYHTTIIFYLENGEVTKVVLTGVLERVPLPDGGIFIAAGQADDFGYFPHHGSIQNLDGFCAALSA